MNFVVVDLGASGTRHAGKDNKLMNIPNNAAFIGLDEVIEAEVGDDFLDALDVTIKHPDDKTGFFPMRALMGSMAERCCRNNVYPSMNKLKVEQPINHLSAIVAAARNAYLHPDETEIRLYVALPPTEAKIHRDRAAERFAGTYEVIFNKIGPNGTTINLNIKEVKILEESAMAMVSYFLSAENKSSEKVQAYRTGTLMSIDIGASTTDIAMYKGNKLLDKTTRTYKVGGNMVRDYVMEQANGLLGFSVPISEADNAVATGRLKKGSSYTDFSSVLDAAKRSIAQTIANSMETYFSSVGIPIQTIDAIITSGGGSMCSKYINEDGEEVITTNPMSLYLTDAIRDICDTVVVEEHSSNPRFANLMGMLAVARMDAFNDEKQAALAQAASTTPAAQAVPAAPVQATVQATPVAPVQVQNTPV